MMAPLSETRRVSIKQPAEEEVVKVSMHWTEAWKVTAMHAKFCEDLLHVGVGTGAKFSNMC